MDHPTFRSAVEIFDHVRQEPENLYDTIRFVEDLVIEMALGETGGNITKAAYILGLKRTTLSMKIRGARLRKPTPVLEYGE